MKTTSIKASDIKKEWLTVDAADQSLGRLASDIAYTLRGKHKPSFVPHLDCGDCVIVVNADKIRLTGKKWDQKVYYHHTGYIGGIKAISASALKEKKPENLIMNAVKGMLPKNKLGRKMLKNLRVCASQEHSHKGQTPKVMPQRTKDLGKRK